MWQGVTVPWHNLPHVWWHNLPHCGFLEDLGHTVHYSKNIWKKRAFTSSQLCVLPLSINYFFEKRMQCSIVNLNSDEHSCHFLTRDLQFWLPENLHGLHRWTNMADADLSLRPFRMWQDHCNIYVHRAAIGGGTTFPYEQLTPTSTTNNSWVS